MVQCEVDFNATHPLILPIALTDHPIDRVMPEEHQIMNNDAYTQILNKLTIEHPFVSPTLIADTLDQAINEINAYNQTRYNSEAII